MIGSIINLFYPAVCRVCDKRITVWNQAVCRDCLSKIKKRTPPFCIKCGRQLAGKYRPQDTCSDCKKNNFYFDRALSVFCYDGPIKGLIHDFKYKKITSLAKDLAEPAADFMKKESIGIRVSLVLSIPMHPARLFKREINPSHIIAKEIAKRLGIAYSGSILKKTKNTPPQTNLTRSRRINNVKGSFSVDAKKIASVQGRDILLVDDLFTTGSTINECARALKTAGSGYIEAITLARGDNPAL